MEPKHKLQINHVIYVAPHERNEVVQVWKDKLTEDQQDRILDMDVAWKITFKSTGAVIEPMEL